MSAQAMRRTGWVLSGLFILFMLFDVAIKRLDLAVVDEPMLQRGYRRGVGFWIGMLETVRPCARKSPASINLGHEFAPTCGQRRQRLRARPRLRESACLGSAGRALRHQ
jgi:hypothetical protein